MSESFLDRCLAGEVLPEDIDDFVDRWHDEQPNATLAQFLGMKISEYKRWAIDASVLPYILNARRTERSLREVLEAQADFKIAARSGSSADASKISRWLQENWEDSWGDEAP